MNANLENAVVIIGVKTPSSSGEYFIPETIDNKKVIAIMGLTFCDDDIKSTVKKVVVPASMKTIWNNAFAPKSNRTVTLTIHCS